VDLLVFLTLHFLVVAVGFFFGTMSILEGKGISGAQDRISTVSQFPLDFGNHLTCLPGIYPNVNP
jgi:hypothetical protein